MKKIPTLFKRNPDNMRAILPEVHPDCEWVLAGEGIATRKYDGTCCLIEGGVMYKRREVKKGKPVPDGFIQADYDEITGKTVGWIPADAHSKDDQWHFEAFKNWMKDGTYELIGPKVQGNPENAKSHMLVKHDGATQFHDAPRDFIGLAKWLEYKDMEGLVFHHPDGRMAKIKKRDFGLVRKI